MAYDANRLLQMQQAEPDDPCRASRAGDIPNDEAKGTAIISPGTAFSESTARMVSLFAWQGKVYRDQAGLFDFRPEF